MEDGKVKEFKETNAVVEPSTPMMSRQTSNEKERYPRPVLTNTTKDRISVQSFQRRFGFDKIHLLKRTLDEMALSSVAPISNRSSMEKVVSAEQIKQFVEDFMPSVQLDDDVSEVLQEIATDFVDRLLDYSSQMAKHRHSKTLEVEDVQFSLEQRFSIPGLSDEQVKPKEMPESTDEHLKRLSLKRKAIRKFQQK